MAKIKQILAREILNSKGSLTLETTVVLSDGTVGIASVPSGTSIGSYEAKEIEASVALQNIQNEIAPRLLGIEADKQREIDKIMIELDGTPNKARLGANSILSVSMALAKAAAESSVLPLFLYLREFVKREESRLKMPTPAFNLINGGKHAGGKLDIQEFLVIPATSKTYSESLEIGVSIYKSLKTVLESYNLRTLTGDEGGFSPSLSTNTDSLLLLQQAINATPNKIGFDVFFGLDCAANNFFHEDKYQIIDGSDVLSSNELINYYLKLNEGFHLLYLEDPLSEDDWEGWSALFAKISQETLVVGDDLTATNPQRLQMAIGKKAISGIIIKPNQIGTVIEALALAELAREAGLKIIVSHRSGETNDDFIADFAVAVSADYVKFGAPARGERVAKYNRLLQIEKQIKAL